MMRRGEFAPALEHAGWLADEYPQHAQVVMLRYFGGLSMNEIADTLDISLRTAERDWAFARAWLRHTMEAGAAADDE